MTGVGNDMQLFHAMHPCQRLAIQIQHHGIVAADDGKRGRFDAFGRVSGEIGSAPAQHTA